MIIQTKTNQIVEHGAEEAQLMTVNSEGVKRLMGYVSESIAKNPIRYTCQEICSNMIDSVVESGKDPILFPSVITVNSDCVLFTDKGVGIGEERIKIFTSFGDSTKRESNEQLGNFGIGAKSPFSVSSSFIVESVHEGVKRVWTIFKNGDDRKYTLDYSIESTEENQTTVKIPIKYGEKYKWLEEAKKVCKYFKGIWIHGEYTFNNSKLIEGNHFYYKESYAEDNLTIVLGVIPYTIDPVDLGFSEFRFPFAIKFGLDEGIYPTISRESIQLDRSTIAKIKSRIQEALIELRNYLVPIDDSNIVTYYSESEKSLQRFNINGTLIEWNRYALSILYSQSDLELFESSKKKYPQNNLGYLIANGIIKEIKVLEKWESKIRGNYIEYSYLPIILDVPFRGRMKSFLRTKGKYQIITVGELEEKSVSLTLSHCGITFDELINLRNEWIGCCRTLSSYEAEYLEWKKSQPKPVKKSTVKQRKFEGSVKFDTGRFHKHTQDCVFDTGYKTITDIKKEKTLYVYSTDKDELVKNWNLISHLNIVPVILNTKEIPYIQDLSNMVNVKDFRAGKKRNSRKVVTAWWIQKEISKDRTLSEIYNAYLENIPNNLTSKILLIKEYMRKYHNGYLNDSLAEGLYQDYKEKGLLDVGIISEFNSLKEKAKYYKGYELLYVRGNKQDSSKLLREIYILRKKTEIQSRLLKQTKVCKQQD